MDEIINKVANAGLTEINPEDFYTIGKRAVFDLKPLLFEEQILREKEFRDKLKAIDWTAYQDQLVAVYCSADAIIPVWAYMLILTALAPYAKKAVQGTPETLETVLFLDALRQLQPETYAGARVVIKGCSHVPVPAAAYAELTRLLLPHVKSLMYGEPCSTVPVFKRSKT